MTTTKTIKLICTETCKMTGETTTQKVSRNFKTIDQVNAYVLAFLQANITRLNVVKYKFDFA